MYSKLGWVWLRGHKLRCLSRPCSSTDRVQPRGELPGAAVAPQAVPVRGCRARRRALGLPEGGSQQGERGPSLMTLEDFGSVAAGQKIWDIRSSGCLTFLYVYAFRKVVKKMLYFLEPKSKRSLRFMCPELKSFTAPKQELQRWRVQPCSHIIPSMHCDTSDHHGLCSGFCQSAVRGAGGFGFSCWGDWHEGLRSRRSTSRRGESKPKPADFKPFEWDKKTAGLLRILLVFYEYILQFTAHVLNEKQPHIHILIDVIKVPCDKSGVFFNMFL